MILNIKNVKRVLLRQNIYLKVLAHFYKIKPFFFFFFFAQQNKTRLASNFLKFQPNFEFKSEVSG